MSFTMQCGVCTKPIRENSEKVFCFGPCGLIKHLKCSEEVNKEGLQAMATNRGLKYFCHKCRQQQIGYNTLSKKCDDILKAMSESSAKWNEIEKRMKKVEDTISGKLKSEFEKVAEKIAQISEENSSVKQKLEELLRVANNQQSTNQEKLSFADAVKMDQKKDEVKNDQKKDEEKNDKKKDEVKNDQKKDAVKNQSEGKARKSDPVVVVKPKNTEQTSAETRKDLRNKIASNVKQIQTVRRGNSGTVFLEVKKDESIETVAAAVKEKCGEGYEVFIPKRLRPRLKIVGATEEYDEESLEECLIEHNEWLREIYVNEEEVVEKMGIKLITCFSSGNGDFKTFTHIVEVDTAAHEAMLNRKRVKLEWDKCRVYETHGIVRCFKCCAYGHKSTECENEETCSKCAEKHSTSECESSLVRCANCEHANKTRKLRLNTGHYASSLECEVYKRLVARKRQQTGYETKDK